MNPVKTLLDTLCAYYGDKDGHSYRLNAVQVTVYTRALTRFDAATLEAAGSAWIAKSRFFPKVSDLLDILQPAVDDTTAAHLAWSALERAVRRVGAYRGVTFANGGIGETVRQVFGSWAQACSFDLDSPGWAIRRQTFLALYAHSAKRVSEPVTLMGMHRSDSPVLIEPVPGLPLLEAGSGDEDGVRFSRGDATKTIADIKRRFLARPNSEAS